MKGKNIFAQAYESNDAPTLAALISAIRGIRIAILAGLHFALVGIRHPGCFNASTSEMKTPNIRYILRFTSFQPVYNHSINNHSLLMNGHLSGWKKLYPAKAPRLLIIIITFAFVYGFWPLSILRIAGALDQQEPAPLSDQPLALPTETPKIRVPQT